MFIWFTIAGWLAGSVLPSARAAESPATLSWSDLPAAAHEAFRRGPGASFDAQVEGAARARKAAALPIESLYSQFQPDTTGRISPLDSAEFALQFSIGNRRGATQRAWDATAQADQAARDEASFDFVQTAQHAWLSAWVAWEMAQHLETFADELAVLLAPLRSAAARSVMAPHTLADLDVEVGRLHAEASAARVEASRAEVLLAQALGQAVHIDPSGMPDLESDAFDRSNPWTAVLPHVESHPEIRALEAQQALESAQAYQARWSQVALLGLGAGVRATETGKPWATPLAMLTIPLQNPEAPLVKRHEAQAQALAHARTWRESVLTAQIEAEAAVWEAAVARVDDLSQAVEAPLRARLDRLQAALVQGAIDASPVILAIRDLHEAHHQHALALADLIQRRAHAQALQDALDTEDP